MRMILALAMLAALSPCAAQQVYKCADARGNPVYSQRPCADDPAKVEVVDTSRSAKTGSGLVLPPSGIEQAAQQIGQQAVCEQREREIAARYRVELAQIDREIADNTVGQNQRNLVELTARRQALERTQAKEIKKAAKQCRQEKGG